MQKYSIKDRCHINTNFGVDTFVGVKCDCSEFSINFPLGFRVSDDEEGLRKDILLLFTSIAETTGRKESVVSQISSSFETSGFPIAAYLFLIADYFEHGYYKEKEVHYQVENRGKINWGRTIKTQKPYVQDNDAYYLKFVTRRNPVSENELITLIHEYCVYDSFAKIGWLFTRSMPKKPRIKLNIKLFKAIIQDKFQQTFNDDDKSRFNSMLAILDGLSDPEAPLSFQYGTNRFEYVWEALIDKVYGINGKEEYFPKTTWKLAEGSYDNAVLEPDSIMIWNGNVYVLDAKYYKYGVTRKPWDLPESTSINKQITYGEYIAEQEKFKEKHGDSFVVYNAFLMPFSSKDTPFIQHVGEAVSNLKENAKTYERIQGVLIDVKHLMSITTRQNKVEIMQLAKCIESALDKSEI